MKTCRSILLGLCCLITSVTSLAQHWSDAASVKKELIRAAQSGQSYYSQYNFYNPRKSGSLNSTYGQVLQCLPLIYGNLIKIVKDTWRERRAIACFSWHLENPYVPSEFPTTAGFRYTNNKKNPDYPVQHRYVIKEILENSGELCGKGNVSGKDNARS